MSTQYYSVKDVLEKLQISRATLYRWIDEGLSYRITGARTKMFDLEEVRDFQAKRKSDANVQLVVEQEYTNDDIVNLFHVGKMGGIRRSNTKNVMVLINRVGEFEDYAHSYWKEDILYFSGVWTRSLRWDEIPQNKSLAESEKKFTTVYLFEIFSTGHYRYRGIVTLAGEPFVEEVVVHRGQNGHIIDKREVVRFPLKLVNSKDYLSEELMVEEEKVQQSAIDIMPRADVIEAAVRVANQPVSERTVLAKRIQRNPMVRKYALLRANGYCELCGKRAPFEYKGEPFLEIDHIIPIPQGGTDTIDNVAAVCPNCNRMKAMIYDKEMILELKRNIAKNEQKLQENLKGGV